MYIMIKDNILMALKRIKADSMTVHKIASWRIRSTRNNTHRLSEFGSGIRDTDITLTRNWDQL